MFAMNDIAETKEGAMVAFLVQKSCTFILNMYFFCKNG